MKKINTLIIWAHPDDEILWCWGYISKFSSEENIYILIVTDWSSSQYLDKKYIDLKKIEANSVKNLLWIKEYFWWELPDMKLDTVAHIKINKIIEKTINFIKPTKVFTHHWWDINRDHVEVFNSTLVACRPTNNFIKEIYCYETPSSTEWKNNEWHYFNPNYFEILSLKNIKSKINAIELYKTELRNYPHPRSKESLLNLSKFRWNNIIEKYAESFYLLRKIN